MVKCKVCNKEFKGITPTHLRKSHGMTMADYRAKFPDAPLRDVSREQRENYSKSAKDRWADPEFHAANAPRLAAMGADANESLQEKRRIDPEFNEEWLEKVRASAEERKGKTRAGVKIEPKFCVCGTAIVQKATQCQPCYQASRLEKAMHPCGHPDCDTLVKGQKEYCSDKCLKSDPAYLENKRRAGRVSQELHPENQNNLVKGSMGEVLNRPDVREKQRAASSLAHKDKSKPIEQRQKMSQSRISYLEGQGVFCSQSRWERPLEWNIISEQIRERDKCCRQCSTTKTRRALDVHHLDGDTSNNDFDNLVALCQPCHTTITMTGNKWRP